MPKGFTEREKAMIRSKLMEKGKEMLAAYGIRKTNVEDLTNAAGISKGAFYQFFESKEVLFFEVLESEEARIRIALQALLEADEPLAPKQVLKRFLSEMMRLAEESPMLVNMRGDELELLLRKLPEKLLAEHMQRDDAAVFMMLQLMRSKGWIRRGGEEQDQALARLLPSLFFLTLHKDEIGSGYDPMIELLVEMMADYLSRPPQGEAEGE